MGRVRPGPEPSQLAGVLMMLVALVVVGTQRAARQA